ncbi:hypothetical protein NESM_000193300 [Novymonas esmeraldas]|uniref:Uncharacterized protein n=1 Tax=Novymonas esmeraldas TaxID=1808958 RepID=A0AAW0F9F8_9TRYP
MSHHQRSTRATLPALRHTAPDAFLAGVKQTEGVYKPMSLSLDGVLRQVPARVTAAFSSTSSLGSKERSSGPVVSRPAPSPAEALLAMSGPYACAAEDGVQTTPAAGAYSGGAGSWRSELLRCETELRELVTRGVQDPPTLPRTVKTIDLFDRVASIAQAQPACSFMGDLMRLFRVEFCRSIFLASGHVDVAAGDGGAPGDAVSGITGLRPGGRESVADVDSARLWSGGAAATTSGSDGDGTRAYFEEAESLRRAKAYLTAALSKGASGESLLLLQRRIEDKDEQLAWYECELERVRRQYDQVSEECRQLRQRLEAEAQEAASVQRQLQRDIQTLHVENKDVQLQLFRLRKQMAGGKTNQLKEGYRQLKLTKMAQTQSLFDEGDERVVLLVLLGQVESRVNEVLDAYDNDFVLTPEAGRRELQTKMAKDVVVLLEDMHFCEAAYRRLVAANPAGVDKTSFGAADDGAPASRVPLELVHTGKDEEAPDETDGFVAVLFDQRVYEHFQSRHATQQRLQHYQAATSRQSAAVRAASPISAPEFVGTDAGRSHQATQREALPPILQDQRDAGAVDEVEFSDDATSRPSTGNAVTPVRSIKTGSLDSHLLWPAASLPPLSANTSERFFSLTPPPALQMRGTDAAPAARGGHRAAADPVSSASPTRPGREQRAGWVANVLGPAATTVAFTVPRPNSEQGDVVVVQHHVPDVVPAEAVMQRVLRRPMHDLSSERFLSTVEVFTGEDPVQQKLLCRVHHVDPSLPIQVPDATNFVKIKYAYSEAASLAERASVASQGLPEGRGSGTATGVYRGNPSLRLFKELGCKSLVENNPGLQYRAGAVSSTTASTVAFQRLHPLSPNRAPEWLLYQQLFGAYRSLTPRMIEVTTIDHLMACASERFFVRMEYRYDECIARAAQQCANLQLRQDMAERLFKDMYVLSDFQEALVDELEARYGYPELVAKTLYEILCYLDAVVEKDSVLAAYLDVIRGFASPTQVHFVSYMLYHLSYCWPSADPTVAVSGDDVRTVLDYLYRNASAMIPIDPEDILKDYDMSSRSAPLTFVSVRQFLASAMVHMEEPLLLHLHGRLHAHTQREATDEITWDTYEAVIAKCGRMKEERRSLVRYLASGLGVNRPTFASLRQLTFLAASAWSSNLWE